MIKYIQNEIECNEKFILRKFIFHNLWKVCVGKYDVYSIKKICMKHILKTLHVIPLCMNDLIRLLHHLKGNGKWKVWAGLRSCHWANSSIAIKSIDICNIISRKLKVENVTILGNT